MGREGGPGYDTRIMGKLSASILAADLARLGDQVKLVEPYAQVFHVDIMDGHFVPPIALGTVVVRSLRPVTERPLHGHLMIEAPESFFDELREAGLDTVSFHLEAVPEPAPVRETVRGKVGVAGGSTVTFFQHVTCSAPLVTWTVGTLSTRPSFRVLRPSPRGS